MEADKIRKLALARLGEHTPNERPGPCGGRTDSPSLSGSESSFGESVLGEADRTKLDLWRTLSANLQPHVEAVEEGEEMVEKVTIWYGYLIDAGRGQRD